MANPGATQPDLVSDLSRMQKRLDDLERRPAPASLYDTYPCVEWGAIGRPRIGGNLWSSCGVSNVTGGKFDRIEAKFITDWILNGRSEAEIRIAAFKHSHANQSKTCVSASSTIRLTGNWVADETTGRVNVGLGKWRWMHGLPRGWNVDTDDEDAIYTIELQHRNPDDCLQVVDPSTQVLAYTKKSNETAPAPLGVWDPIYVDNDTSGTYRMIAERRDRNASGDWPGKAIWVTTEPGWDGAYSVSNMHYCVGMSSDQLPEASEAGWFWYSGGDAEFTRQPNIEEGYTGI